MKSAANSLESLSKSELIAALQARELMIKNQLQEHNKQLAQRDNIITLLEEKLRLLRCQGYGARSEQRGNDPQADLFNEVDAGYRLYIEEGLQLRTKKRKKLQRLRQPMEVPTRVNQRWSMDFVSDQLSNGRLLRVLNVVDDFSRKMVGQLVSVSITGARVARFLDQLFDRRNKPGRIICDNGTEFTSKAMFFWSQESGDRAGARFYPARK